MVGQLTQVVCCCGWQGKVRWGTCSLCEKLLECIELHWGGGGGGGKGGWTLAFVVFVKKKMVLLHVLGEFAFVVLPTIQKQGRGVVGEK